MSARFTLVNSSTGSYVNVTAAADFAGFSFTWGTFAIWINFVTLPTAGSGGCIIATNGASGACFEIYIDGNAPTLFDWWDGTNDRTFAGAAINSTMLFVAAKASGTQTGRGHLYIPATNTWTHTNFSGTSVDSAANTSLTIGCETVSFVNLDAEIFEIGMWQGLNMSDNQVEQLAKVDDWGRFAPNFYKRWSDGRDADPMTRSTGLSPVRATTSSAITRGVQRNPSGFHTSPRNRRR